MTPLVFLHGWGQSRQIWFQQFNTFPDAIFLNLPGHGGADDSDQWLQNLSAQLPDEPSTLVGWSLGGILAMQLATAYPEKIASLVLVATTPCFRSVHGWNAGCSDELFEGFRKGLDSGSAKSMSRFFTLMLHGDGLVRAQFNKLAKVAVDRSNPPTAQALLHGLTRLASTDLRDSIAGIKQPALVMHGDSDAIIQPDAGRFLAEHLPCAAWYGFQTCGHAPFLTQAKTFNEQLEAWCLNTSTADR